MTARSNRVPLAAPPFSVMPSWVVSGRAHDAEEAAFLSGAALALLDAVLRRDHRLVYPAAMKLTNEHRSALDDILKWRRDVRHFRRDPIDTAILQRLRHSIDPAPSVGNARPWRIVQVETATARSRIIEIFEVCNAEAARDYDRDTRRDYLSLKLAGLREAPDHLAVFTGQAVAEGRGLGRRTMPETLAYSIVMAIHTLWLAARAENIGLGWVSILAPATVATVLETPLNWSLTDYLCLGHVEAETDTPLLHETGWQTDTRTDWQVV